MWAAPDRLDLSGTFTGLDDEPAGEPELVVDGATGVHRLPAVAGSASGPPAGTWEAAFAWREAPEGFERARLEFANGIGVELPPPAAKRSLRRQVIDVQLPGEDGADPAADGPIGDAMTDAEAEPTVEPVAETPGAADGLRLQAALLAAEETAREAEAAARQAETELTRARDDLATEREGRRVDAERFRQRLDGFQASAADAVTAEQAARRDTESQLEPLRERIAALEQAAADADAMRADLDDAREQAQEAGAEAARLRGALEAAEGQAQAARAELAASRSALDEVREDAERLLRHLVPGDEGSARE
jgi:hypothetical protein